MISSEGLHVTDSMLEDAGCNCTQVVQADHKHTPADSTLVFGWVHSVSYIRGEVLFHSYKILFKD